MTDINDGVASFAMGRQEPVDPEVAALLAKGDAQFLQSVGIGQPLSDLVMAGKARPGDWILGWGDDARVIRDADCEDGGVIHVVVGPERPHAQLMVDRKVVSESFVPDSPEFRAIEQEALSKRKGDSKRRASFGVDMLLWLITEGVPAVYYAKSTARREAGKILGFRGKPIALGVDKIERANTWWVPEMQLKNKDGSPIVVAMPTLDGRLIETAEATFAKVRNDEKEAMARDAAAAKPNSALPPR